MPGAKTNPSSRTIEPLKVGSDIEISQVLCRLLIAELGLVIHCDGEFWYYTGTNWTNLIENELRKRIYEFDGLQIRSRDRKKVVRLSKSRIDSIIHETATMLSEPSFFVDPEIGINCGSGFIRIPKDGCATIEPHSPDHKCRHVLPAKWQPGNSTAPTRNSQLGLFLTGLFRDDEDRHDKINLVAELLGTTALGHGCRLTSPKAIILKGAKAENGKSQLLDLLRYMLPLDAVSAIPPTQFSSEQFAIGLIAKHLNACDELGMAKAIESDRFKAIITGEPISARDLYRSAVSFRPVALHVFATNTLPSFHGGMDRGVKRRLMVVTFNRVIPKNERIQNIAKKISKEEGDLLLSFAVYGARRILQQGHYTEPQSSKEALLEWLRGADPVIAWIDDGELEHILVGEGGKVRTRIAYQKFRNWAIEEGFAQNRLPAISQFTQRVSVHSDTAEYVRRSDGGYFIDRTAVPRF